MKTHKFSIILMFFLFSLIAFSGVLTVNSTALACAGNFNFDTDIDGHDLAEYINDNYGLALQDFAEGFGESECTLTQEVYKTGLSVALTGLTSDVGNYYANGVDDYFNFANSTGVIGINEIMCSIVDDGYELQRTRSNFQSFIDENILVFLGYSTGSILDLKNDFEREMIPVIPASLHYDNIVGSNYIYLFGASYDEQVVALGEYIDNFHPSGTPKVALYVHPSSFGRSPAEAIATAVTSGLINIDLIDTIEHGNINHIDVLNNLMSQGVQYIICQSIQSPVADLLNAADSLGMIASSFGESGKITFLGAHYTGGNILLSLIDTSTTNYFWVTPLIGMSEPSDGKDKQYNLAQMYNRDHETANSVFYTNGILVAQITTEAIKRLLVKDISVTRSSIKSELELMNGNNAYLPFSSVGPVDYSLFDRAGVNTLRIYQIQDNVFKTYGNTFSSSIY